MSTVGIRLVQTSIQNIFPGNVIKPDSSTAENVGFGCVLDQRMQLQKNNVQSKQTKQAEKTNSHELSSQNKSVSSKTDKARQSEHLDKEQSISEKEEPELLEEEQVGFYRQLQNACDELKQVLQDQLGLSEKELEQALEEYGITLLDLFEPNHLTNFFLQMNEVEDFSALLTDEVLAMNLQNLLDTVEEMNPLEDLNLATEDVSEIIEIMEVVGNEKAFDSESQQLLTDQTDMKEEFTKSTEDASQQLSKQIQVEEQTEKDATSSEEHSQRQEAADDVKLLVNGSIDVSTQTKIHLFDQLAPTSEAKEIVNQIVREIKVTLSSEQASMEIVLMPESLGKVNLTVSSKNGLMTAHMVTETQVAKEAIESQLHLLKETLENQGVKVEALEVTVAANQFDFMNQSQMNQKDQEHSSNVKKSNGKLQMMDESEIEVEHEASKETINASIGKGTQIDITV